VIFSYFNPILRLGLERFCDQAAHSGVDGVLITDVIVEEAGEYLAQVHHHGLMPVFLAAPTSTDQRLKMIANACQGFVYAISRVGITGAQRSVADDARPLVGRLRKFTQLPIAVGFGISTAEHVAAVGEFADAVVIGSAIVSLIEKAEPGKAPAVVASFLQSLRRQPVLQG
jgi:tryptophan synthase alpha chain